MQVLGIRFCALSPEAEALAAFFEALGLSRQPWGPEFPVDESTFVGAVFPVGPSWIEMWPPGAEMPEGIMLQLVVDDADAFAAHARQNGLAPEGPLDAHGERIYFLHAPGGLPISFQSRLPS